MGKPRFKGCRVTADIRRHPEESLREDRPMATAWKVSIQVTDGLVRKALFPNRIH